MTKKIVHNPDDAVIDVLRRSTCVGNTLTLPEQLDRKLYLDVMKALELVGGKWSRKQKCHVFDADCGPLVEDIVATGAVLDLQKTYQFFPTPPDVVARLIELAELRPGMSVLEPSAGDGAIVRALPTPAAGLGNGNIRCFACEVQSDKRAALLDAGAGIIGQDFMDIPTHHKFDRIIANPPFARGQDVQHVSKMIDHLEPGGRLVTVMSPGWRFRQTEPYRSFQLRLKQKDVRWRWHELEPGAFRVSGTNVRTGILVVDKAVG